MAIHHCTLLATKNHSASSSSSLKWDAHEHSQRERWDCSGYPTQWRWRHIACQLGDVDIVRHLIIDERCNPNIHSSTSLHIAIKWSKTVAISILLADTQCNINVQNKVGDTPLHIATKNGQDNAIFQLLSCKECNPNIQNKEGDTLLHIAVRQNKTAAISKLLTQQFWTWGVIVLYTLLATGN